jgi:hypothetical protein
VVTVLSETSGFPLIITIGSLSALGKIHHHDALTRRPAGRQAPMPERRTWYPASGEFRISSIFSIGSNGAQALVGQDQDGARGHRKGLKNAAEYGIAAAGVSSER